MAGGLKFAMQKVEIILSKQQTTEALISLCSNVADLCICISKIQNAEFLMTWLM